jgi:hypothetical protein
LFGRGQAVTFGNERLKGAGFQRTKLADATQPVVAHGFHLRGAAGAGYGAAEGGVLGTDIGYDEAKTAAVRAVGIAASGLLRRRRLTV